MNPIAKQLGALRIGPPRSSGSLTIFPLTSDVSQKASYVLLDEALATKSVTVTEVSLAGSVPELRIENRGEAPILIVDGEALIGAKQNRICNITVLIPAKTVMNIPVSCVERGRWSYRRNDFDTTDHVLYNTIRARKAHDVTASLRNCGAARSDQGEIWRDISLKSQRMAASSPSEAMSALFASADDRLTAMEQALAPRQDEVGAIFASNSCVVGLEAFDSPSSWQRFARKILRSHALDVLDEARSSMTPFREPDDLRRAVYESAVAEFPSVGLGTDIRLEHPSLSGGALVAQTLVVHVSVFVTS